MANESIAFDVELKTAKAATGVQSLRTELKNLRNQLASLDEGSAEFSKIAAKAGAVQDKIGDLKDTIAAFHPERKFQAFTQGIQGVVGGFTAVQGAMALFGNESEDLQKTLVKVQGAMALSQGLNSLMGLGDAFKNLKLVAVSSFATIRTAAIATFTTIKGAMAATGIGALVVALGFLVAKFIETSAANKEATEKEKEYTEATKKAKEATEEKVAALNLEILAIEKKTNLAGATLLTAKAEVELLKNQIAYADDYNAKQKDGFEIVSNGEKSRAISVLLETKDLKDKLKLKEDEVVNLQKIADKVNELEGVKKTADAAEKARLKVISDAEKAKEKAAEKAAKKIEDDKKAQQQYFDFLVSSKESEKALWDKSVDDFVAAEDEKFKRLKGFRDAEAEYDALMLEKKKNNFADISSLLTSFSGMAGQQSEEGKALAIAAAVIDTYAAAWSIFKSSAKTEGNPYTPWLHAAAAIAGGLMNVQKIMAVDAKGQTSAGGGNTSAPPPMTRPQSSRVSLDSGGKPISVSDKSRQRVYVVERDITNTQSRVSVIQNRAKFG